MAAKKKTGVKKEAKRIEQSLWDTANKLRGSVESSEYKHVVLGLIFLKFASDKFKRRRAEMIADALPDNYFSRLGLDTAKLASLIDSIDDIDTVADRETDVVGRVYEYFLGKFAADVL